MNQTDALKLLAVLKAAYPREYSFLTKEEASGIANVWVRQFHKLPYEIVSMAVEKYISTETKPPTIAGLKDKLSSIHWEAYEQLRDDCMNEYTAEEYKLLNSIYEVTKPYRYKSDGGYETSLIGLLGGRDGLTEKARLLLQEEGEYE